MTRALASALCYLIAVIPIAEATGHGIADIRFTDY